MTGAPRLAAVALAAALVVVACGSGDGGGPHLPDGALRPLDGGPAWELAGGTGRPAVVNLWATWCVPCRVELPAFDGVARRAGGAVDVVGVNVGDEAEDATAMVEELRLAFRQLHDPQSELSRALEVVQMPTTAFVDADGAVVATHAGALDADELVRAIAEHLGVTIDG